MDEEDALSEKPESVSNGNAEVDRKTEAVTDKKGEVHDGIKETEEDRRDNVEAEAQHMDLDKEEVSENNKTDKIVEDEMIGKEEEKEESTADEEKQETGGDIEKEEIKNEKVEEDPEGETKNATKNKSEGEVDGIEEEENPEETNKGKGSKKCPRTTSSAPNKDKINERDLGEKTEKGSKTTAEKMKKNPKSSEDNKGKKPKTPATSTIERPVREWKSVERLVSTIEKDSAKDFHIEKGCGNALKDIPNVTYKLSRKQTEDTFKLLHTILFGKRGKATQIKNNILRFSGFIWHDNKEKQMTRVKEKLDKCVKEKLLEFCDVLDIAISKANMKKEDIIAKLIDFLMAPYATTSELLAEKEQSSKGKKRERISKAASGSSTPSKGSAKSQKKTESSSKKSGETKSTLPELEDESIEEKEERQKGEDANGIPEGSGDKMSEKESESEKESDKGRGKQKQGVTKSSSKEGSAEKATTKKKTFSTKASPPPEKAPAKLPPRCSKNNTTTSKKKSSVMEKDESIKKSSAPKRSASKESTGKKVMKVKDKPKVGKLKPNGDQLRCAISENLKEIDFNTATFTDVLKLL